MSNELMVITPLESVSITSKRWNYEITTPSGIARELKRDVDFGNPKKANGEPVFPKPILYKSGAEKIIRDFKLLDRYTVESCIEDVENGIFSYRVKCSLVAYNPATGQEIVYCEGLGCANTRESKTGNQSGFDGANSALKKAKKRAMVDAAISLGTLSSMFTADLEDTAFMKGADEITKLGPDDAITTKQRRRIFAIADQHGMTQEQAKTWLTAQGFASTKDIRQKDYDALCSALEEKESK
ncbi:MAG: hypothetical protein ACRC1I_05505 [Pseudomonas proteolytica]|uniref:hypothetical protein n=1 Tax=Pseudomonas proteolytica TaxID=219574 RepID=UPI003F418045